MTRKIIAFLLLVLITGITVGAEELPKLTPSVSVSEENGTVELTVSISENSNICGCGFTIVYDNSKLKYNSYVSEDAIKNTALIVNENYSENSIRVAWATVEELTVGGDVINVEFDIVADAAGTTEIQLDNAKMADVNGNKVECLSENVSVLIPGKSSDDKEKESNSPSSGGGSSKPNGNKDKTEKPVITVGPEEDYEVFLLGFDDVNETDWFYESVKFVKENNYMTGVSETEFAPNNKLTRAMLVTILHRIAGEGVVNKSIPFGDVDMGSWYADAVSWAKQNGIVNGVTENEFAPDANITREQIATIMFRFAQYKGMSAVTLEENLHFADADKISEYAVSAMNWAVGTGLMKGKSETTINPKDNATRAEIAAVLQRFIENK